MCFEVFLSTIHVLLGTVFLLQAKNHNAPGSQGRWPKKSAEILLQLLKNAESNADVKVDLQTASTNP